MPLHSPDSSSLVVAVSAADCGACETHWRATDLALWIFPEVCWLTCAQHVVFIVKCLSCSKTHKFTWANTVNLQFEFSASQIIHTWQTLSMTSLVTCLSWAMTLLVFLDSHHSNSGPDWNFRVKTWDSHMCDLRTIGSDFHIQRMVFALQRGETKRKNTAQHSILTFCRRQTTGYLEWIAGTFP